MENCIFCKIVNQQLPNYKIYEDEFVYAFLDHLPNTVGHSLVIPKKHFANFSECDDAYLAAVSIAAKKVAEILKATFQPAGFNYISNEGAMAYQVVFHYHLHIIPKYEANQGYVLHRNINRGEMPSNEEVYAQIIEQTKNQ